ncbi:MAG: hypothetical protein HC913_02890 [Microscillaceae bacterium]|nr:hypothetical protein [Microscillaceae bacterium]
MKKCLIFLMLCLSLGSSLRAQVYVNGIDINQQPDLVYIELIVDNRAFQRQPFAVIDHGQLIWPSFQDDRITNAQGEPIRFNGEMAIFNFLYKNGWQHEITYSKETYALHIFKRRVIGAEVDFGH